MNKNVKFIPYNCGAGAQTSGCEKGALVLKNSVITDSLWGEFYHHPDHNKAIETDQASIERIKVVGDSCKRLCNDVSSAVKCGYVPFTIGGDHSMGAGSVAGLAEAYDAAGKTGLIWVDAHLDGNTMATSPSKALHGMPVSALLGYGIDEMVNVTSGAPVVLPENLCLIGGRSFEDGEDKLYRDLGVTLFLMDDIKEMGIGKVIREAIKIASNGTKCKFLSIDTDAFDPLIAPSVGSPENNGIWDGDMEIMMKFFGKAGFDAYEIAEYNPDLSHDDGRTRALIKRIIDLLLD